ncbi:F0F1 ATP synthase subunit delta [Georgenia wangjunii]|uniref:F0F1 ATP synthase subunit delta n=1 Tax=Georgenia wangjunii TaxID=3117730 RepID=UPI002F260419
MRASSQAALAAAVERWEAVVRERGEASRAYGEQLFAVADTLTSSASLRRALTEPSRDGGAKAGLVAALFSERVAPEVVDLLCGLARSRWSGEHDLVEAVEELGLTSVLAAAQARGDLLRVEEELFSVDRTFSADRELRTALADRDVAPERRTALVASLLAGKVAPETDIIVRRVVTTLPGRSLASALHHVSEVAAARRERLVATVTAAAPLSHAQEERLAAILGRAYGQAVQVNVGVDPAVVGGMRVQVGPEVIDGTVRTRLQDAQRRLAG